MLKLKLKERYEVASANLVVTSLKTNATSNRSSLQYWKNIMLTLTDKT